MQKLSFFLFIFLIALIPNAQAVTSTATATLIPTDEIVIDEEVELSNNQNLDVSAGVNPTQEETKTIGGEAVELTQEFKFNSDSGDDVVIENVQLTSVSVEIPNQATVKAPDEWNGQITPPKSVSTTGTVSGNFLTPTSAILVGSPDVILVFNKAVTLLLTGTTGQTAYKTPGSNTWILIDGCTGTYANPNDPPVNGECSISNGADTKILTFHFTQFAGLSATPASTPTATAPTTSNSGGHGNTNVGSPRIFGSSGGSSGGGVIVQGDSGRGTIPPWFDYVMEWYRQGDITPLEFLNAYDWIIRNIVK